MSNNQTAYCLCLYLHDTEGEQKGNSTNEAPGDEQRTHVLFQDPVRDESVEGLDSLGALRVTIVDIVEI